MRTEAIGGSSGGSVAARAALHSDRGERVVGIDLRNAEMVIDPGTSGVSQAALEQVAALGGVDAVEAFSGQRRTSLPMKPDRDEFRRTN